MTELVDFARAEPLLDWVELSDALAKGHALAKPEIGDQLLRRGADTLLLRAAWIDGVGCAVKAALVFPDNPASGLPTTNGAMMVFSDRTGILEALVDFRLVTKWKTAADSLLAARRLARPDSRRFLIVGAGAVARSLVEAYSAAFPDAAFAVRNRGRERADAMIAELSDRFAVALASDLGDAVASADVVSCATLSSEPLIRGEWLKPGVHLDLIGAYRPDMREADDEALRRSRIFVDSRDTTIAHIGELKIPIAAGVIRSRDVIADFRDLESGSFRRQGKEDITLFKNGGGAHLDLMTADYILGKWRAR